MTAAPVIEPDQWALPSLPPELAAHEPPEARGSGRDDVRLLVSRRGRQGRQGRQGTAARHARFRQLPDLLRPGDVLVVNTSATLPAAVSAGDLVVHVSTALPAPGHWLVELRRPTGGAGGAGGGAGATAPYDGPAPAAAVELPGGARLTVLAPYSRGRLWEARVEVPAHPAHHAHPAHPAHHAHHGPPDVPAYLARHGRPIRYSYVDRDWPLSAYQTVFADHRLWPGSAEMPSAARPFTTSLVTRLVVRGVVIVPLVLHTGVASAEAHERPYPEWFAVPDPTARVVQAARADGRRVIAVGTTVVRALESAVGSDGRVRGTSGWTDLVVTPERGVRAVGGIVTGLHQPRSSHLDLLAAIAGRDLLAKSYAAAVAERYRWHEFGDSHLILP
jgi:S-adenosylmethionine:tRNA ribosyltransferase-isomerase